MTQNNDFLTVQEAMIFASKSEKTIRNLIDKFTSKNKKTGNITSNDTSKLLVIQKGKTQSYLINISLLKENYNIPVITSNEVVIDENITSNATSNEQKKEAEEATKDEYKAEKVLLETVKILQEQLLVKDDQIFRKDEQLSQAQELVKNTQVLLRQEQEKNKILETQQSRFLLEGKIGNEGERGFVLQPEKQKKQKKRWYFLWIA